LQCAAVCCSVLQCVAVCCSVLQCGAACCSVLQRVAVCHDSHSHVCADAAKENVLVLTPKDHSADMSESALEWYKRAGTHTHTHTHVLSHTHAHTHTHTHTSSLSLSLSLSLSPLTCLKVLHSARECGISVTHCTRLSKETYTHQKRPIYIKRDL